MYMWFTDYGFIDWLEPEEYYSDDWKYHCSAEGADGNRYDIVILDNEWRYTII